MNDLPALQLLSVKIPVADLAASRRWYADVFGLREEMEWPDADGVVRGVAFSGLGDVMLALREHPEAAAATTASVSSTSRSPPRTDLPAAQPTWTGWQCRAHAGDQRASGRLVGFHDPDGHELSFYAKTTTDGVREDSIHPVRMAGPGPTAATAT